MNFLLVGFGAACGAVLRYRINLFFEKRSGDFPQATWLINLSGAFVLGLLAGLNLRQPLYLLLGTGLLGGYTTFSTFNVELLTLYKTNKKTFYWYFATTYSLGLLLSFLGLWLGSLR